ncbi:iron dicitrate transport regulator FecR (plasmid) [Alcanivorax sp. N3-2A]|nr:iron dicitrate transport regulator FecR [Alcanivorax sp. N3-2A]ASK36736.1 iron dicitrate transport regulator FecR [Alcanivorax sp. N3-2A]
MTNHSTFPAAHTDRITREAQDWVIRLASGRATAADGDAFRRWCARSPAHARAFAHCRRVWQGVQKASGETPQEVTPLAPARQAHLTRRAFLGGALAASVGWAALRSPLDLWPRIDALSADLSTQTGEQREVVLANSATLRLNTQTSIDLTRQRDRVTGLVLNTGETEISTAGAFTVTAGNGSVQARRARFNIRYTDDRVRVTCLEGEVIVDHGRHRAQLRPPQQIVYNQTRTTPVRSVDPDRVSAWRQRMLVFDGTPLKQVVEEVNRYRPGRIVLLDETLGRTPVQAYLSLDKLEDFAALVREVHGANVRALPGGVLIIS